MSGIVGQGTTFSLPNFVGELFSVTPTDTPFLSAIGGLTGGVPAKATKFQWQGYDLRSAAQRTKLEGANAPNPEERVRFTVHNVVEVHQEAVEVSYTAQAATGQYGGLNLAGANPVTDEFQWQIEAMLKQIARDVEWSFVNGSLVEPTDNTQARQTQGLLGSIQTNVIDVAAVVATGATAAASTDKITSAAHGLSNGDQVSLRSQTGAAGLNPVTGQASVYYVVNVTTNDFKVATSKGGSAVDITSDGTVDIYKRRAITKADVDGLLQITYENGGISEADTATLMVGTGQKLAVTGAYLTAGNYREQSRNIAGVATSTIETDFGTLNVMLNRYMPKGELTVVSMEECAPVLLEIPDKGFLFVEPLAKVGAANRGQIYGEIGLKYGNEKKHGRIKGAAE